MIPACATGPPSIEKDMTTGQIAATLDEKIREIAEVDPDEPDLTGDAHLFDEGFLDSFGAADLVRFCEETWSIEVSNVDLATRPLNTIDEIAGYVVEKLSAAS